MQFSEFVTMLSDQRVDFSRHIGYYTTAKPFRFRSIMLGITQRHIVDSVLPERLRGVCSVCWIMQGPGLADNDNMAV